VWFIDALVSCQTRAVALWYLLLQNITAPFFNKLKRKDGVALWDVVLHKNLGDSFLW